MQNYAPFIYNTTNACKISLDNCRKMAHHLSIHHLQISRKMICLPVTLQPVFFFCTPPDQFTILRREMLQLCGSLRLVASLCILGGADAFFAPTFGARGLVATAPSTKRQDVSLLLAPDDAAELIKEAEAAAAKFGKDSPEARVAWDSVEEIQGSDNSAATKPGLDQECLLDESEGCLEYERKIEELKMLIKEQEGMNAKLQATAEELKKVSEKIPGDKMTPIPPTARYSAAVTDSGVLNSIDIDEEGYAKAVEEAVVAEREHGVGSPEARALWDIVDEIENSNNTAARMGSLADECLVSASDACESFEAAMEELRSIIGKNE